MLLGRWAASFQAFLRSPLECWDYRCPLSHPEFFFFNVASGDQTQVARLPKLALSPTLLPPQPSGGLCGGIGRGRPVVAHGREWNEGQVSQGQRLEGQWHIVGGLVVVGSTVAS